MNNQSIEIMKMALELSETIGQGLYYIQTNIKSDEEMVERVVEDVLNGLTSVHSALHPVLEGEEKQLIASQNQTLASSVNELSVILDRGEKEEGETFMNTQVVEHYNAWKESIEKAVTPYLYS